MLTEVPVVAPIKFALATLNALDGLMLTTNTALLDAFTTTALPIEAFVPLLKIVTVSVFAVFVLYANLFCVRINLFALATYFSTEVLSKNGYKTVSGLKSVAANNIDFALM